MSTPRDHRLKRMEAFLQCRLAEELAVSSRLHSSPVQSSLTISRQAGALGGRIGEELVEYLGQFDESTTSGWALFDQALVTRVIEDHKLPESLVSRLSENSPSPVSEFIERILGPTPSNWTLFHHTVDTIRKLCAMGNVIIVGRGGNFITRDFSNVFHVRLVGSEARRIETVGREMGMKSDDAERYVRQTDRARALYVSQHLQCEIDDPAAYHLVINTDRFTDELAARIIGDTLLEWQATQSQHNQAATA